MLLLTILVFVLLIVFFWIVVNMVYLVLQRQYAILANQAYSRQFVLRDELIILISNQAQVAVTVIKKLYFWFSDKKLAEQMQSRKNIVLQNVVNHLNENLSDDLGLKTVHPATTGGVDVWVYLATNLSEEQKYLLEHYFIGVLMKYTSEFGLDMLTIEKVAGAGWVAKFDVRIIEEANYNRMARQADVETEEDF